LATTFVLLALAWVWLDPPPYGEPELALVLAPPVVPPADAAGTLREELLLPHAATRTPVAINAARR
jgi:hypothetical protein